jgi:hypothetical protein
VLLAARAPARASKMLSVEAELDEECSDSIAGSS